MATIFRAPLITPQPKRPFIPVDLVPNLLLSTLFVSVTPLLQPFSQHDWPNPIRPKAAPQDFQQSGVNTRGIPPQAGSPFAQTDWVVPVKARQAPQADSPGNTLLLGIPPNLPFAVVAYFDFPTPMRPRAAVGLDGSVANSLLLGIVPQPPFGQSDWPTPTRAKSTPQADSPVSLLPIGIPAPPFAQSDWFSPSRARTALVPDQLQNLLTATLAAVPAPFAPPDLPVLAKSRSVDQAQSAPNQLALGIPPPPPFAQSDWPVPPLRAKATPYADAAAAVQPVVPVAAPFAQTDWPIVYRARSTPQADSLGNVLLSGIKPQYAPFAQIDWSLPPARVRAVPQADAGANELLGTLAPTTGAPFAQTDWPTPGRARLAPAVDAPNALIGGIPPNLPCATVAYFDFPTPARARSTPSPDVAPNLVIGITAQPQPFHLTDWWNPLRARALPQADATPAPVLRGIKPPPAPFSQRDWQNPPRARMWPFESYPNVLLDTNPPAPRAIVPNPKLRVALSDLVEWLQAPALPLRSFFLARSWVYFGSPPARLFCVAITPGTEMSDQVDVTNTVEQFAGSNYPYVIDVSKRSAPQWSASTVVGAASLMYPTDANATGFVYVASAAGQTGDSEPAWPTTQGQTVVDGSLTWTAETPPYAGQDTIASAVWSQISPPDALLIIGTTSTTSFAATGYVGGGTSGNVYTVQVKITMASGAIYIAKLIVNII